MSIGFAVNAILLLQKNKTKLSFLFLKQGSGISHSLIYYIYPKGLLKFNYNQFWKSITPVCFIYLFLI